MIVTSLSTSCDADVPSVRPRATIESFCAPEPVDEPSARATTACEASCTEMTWRSLTLRTCDFLAGPATTRSIASSSVAWSIVSRPSRTLSSAASLTTFASSAPEKPGHSFATSIRSAAGSIGFLRPCSERIS